MTRKDTTWTVGQLADLSGVTVRTLHHYDEIGLLHPTDRNSAGYRLYTEADLVRLQQIVVYRRLEMPLDEIADLLDGSDDAVDHLRRQRATVTARRDELDTLVDAIDQALEREMNNRPATDDDLRELFGHGFSDEYQAEAEERWGDTDKWAQSQARTAQYTKADWAQIKDEQDAANNAFIAAMRAGEPADGDVAVAIAERVRVHMNDRFYDCDHEFHRCLGEMYVSDPRFAATYDDLEPGLSQYVRDAIVANADRHGGSDHR
ncbi:MerR family transcriptional regulator [Gordonia sp. HY002]|uniref:MerR family transcriptional regulator n=1 Tax=Gordonia zhenghanii TaxID=2911516 RepID=UPI001EF05ED5|nr:MerR family transcriptional regulator [Gordonia zhenghanii]MCF8569021.1 MerR family transcriptional regulator [Gordonia zhenghanii]MCF8606345.1 MerR family transcriptional regulator [Gordonia zhenghanii]